MKVDTAKLVDALSKVVDLAHREETARAEVDALNEAIKASQADIDAIADQLIAVAGSAPAANGIAAVAAALTTPVDQPVAIIPTTVLPASALTQTDSVQANIAKMNDMLAALK
jgi:outer membrane protein TolC